MPRPFACAPPGEKCRAAYRPAAAIARASLALLRLAALRWMVPRFAALSMAEIKARACVRSISFEERVRFFKLRNCVRMLRLRRERFAV